jgi:prevent-host-death family protein
MTDHVWSVVEAKANFSELLDRANTDGPQTITRNGREEGILVSPKEWKAHTARKGTLSEFFAASPLRGSGIKIERMKGRLRAPKL